MKNSIFKVTLVMALALCFSISPFLETFAQTPDLEQAVFLDTETTGTYRDLVDDSTSAFAIRNLNIPEPSLASAFKLGLSETNFESTTSIESDEPQLPQEEDLSAQSIFKDLMVPLTAALTILGGFLSYRIPIIQAIPDKTYQVLAFALVVGLGLILFGVAEIWQPAVGYFMGTSLYEVALKPIGMKSPK